MNTIKRVLAGLGAAAVLGTGLAVSAPVTMAAPAPAVAAPAAVSGPVLATKATSTRSCWAANVGHVTSTVTQTSSTSQSYKITVYKPSWYTNWVRAYFDGVGKGYANSTFWVNTPNHALHTIRVSAANGATCSVRH